MSTQERAVSTGPTWALAIAFGLLAALLDLDLAGILISIVLGALTGQIVHWRQRTRLIEEQLREVVRRLEALQARAPRPQQEDKLETAPAAQPDLAQPERIEKPSRPEPSAGDASSAGSPAWQPGKPWTPPPLPESAWEPDVFDRAKERMIAWLKRGNPLARLGIVILFLGAAFLAKYAVDHSLFPIELRFIALAAGALVLLGVGWRLRERRPGYAQLLQGGGLAGLYLTIFAATRVAYLLPFGLAFGLLVLVALASAVIAVAQSSLALAVIGTTGGFVAPILVSTGSGDHIALFSYYALLNLGVFAVAWFKTWRVLNAIGFFFTFSVTALWRISGYELADRLSADLFLILFFLLYVAVSILNSVRQPSNQRGYLSGTLVFGLPVVAFTLHASLVSRIEYALAWSALALGTFYLALGWVLHRTRRESFRPLVEAFAALGVIFASLAIPLTFDTRTTAAMWAVEGAGFVWIGVRQNRKLVRAFGALLQVGAAIGYLLGLHASSGNLPVLNSACLGALMLGVSGVLTAYWLFGNEPRRAQYEAGASSVFMLWGLAWWFFAGLSEFDRFLAQAELGASLVYTSATTVALAVAGRAYAWPLARTLALWLPIVALPVASLVAVELRHPLAQWGAWGWLSLFAAHYWVLRRSEAESSRVPEFLHGAAYVGLAFVLAWEASWQVGQLTAGVWSSLPWGLVPASLMAWVGRKQLAPSWPIAQHSETYRMLGAAPLALAVAAWILIVNLTSAGDPVWLPYLPLVNPLDVSVALCIAATAFWWSALEDSQRQTLWPFDARVLLAISAGLVFVWLNAALIRSLHHNWGAPISLYGLATSTLVQASLSIFWGVLGFIAMTVSARQRWRYVWIVGAALMVVVVVKLFLVDLSSIGTIARITSFLTVGALLLVTGYLAPLPPKKERAHE
jgi:uncharacterized membrane protein